MENNSINAESGQALNEDALFEEQRINRKVTLAKNVEIARKTRGWTQQTLAEKAGTSRATIAQIESGDADPLLSTVTNIATALQISPLLILMNEQEIQALSVRDQIEIPKSDIEKMQKLLDSGLKKPRHKAAKIGIESLSGLKAIESSLTPSGLGVIGEGGVAGFAMRSSIVVLIGTAIGSILTPGHGSIIGGLLGSLWAVPITRNIEKEIYKEEQMDRSSRNIFLESKRRF